MTEKIPYWMSTKCAIKKRGIPPKYTKLTTSQIDEIIKMYETGAYNYKQIAAKFNKDDSSIGDVLNKRGYKAKDQSELQRKYAIDEFFFDTIDSERKAYFLGLLYADGYNNVNNYEISLCLQEKDLHILKAFIDSLQSNRPIGTKIINGAYYRMVNIGNRRLSLALEDKGCGQAKTFSIRMPYFIPDDLLHHFVRGFFDGDGCIFVGKEVRSNVRVTFVSNKIFLSDLSLVLIKNAGVNATKIQPSPNKNDLIGTLQYGGRGNCYKIRAWLYKDATIFLNRKQEKMFSI